MKFFSRRESVLVISLLLLSGILFLVVFLLRGDGSGEWDVVISYHEKEVARLPLETDTEYLFECDEGVNRIVVRNGSVLVSSADCRKQICVHHEPLTPENAVLDSIMCVAHHLEIALERRK